MKNFKTIIALFLFAICATVAKAQSVSATPSPVAIEPGKTATVTISLNDIADKDFTLYGAWFRGSEGLKVTKVARGKSIKVRNDDDEYLFVSNFDEKTQSWVAYNGTSEVAILAEGEVIILTITADASFKGEGTMTLYGNECSGVDAVKNDLPDLVIPVVAVTPIKAIGADGEAIANGKFVKDGKVVIVKGDNEYNANGAAIK